MPVRPQLVRNIAFWILLIVSLGATIGGALVVKIELDWMTTALTANTATGVDVYVGQVAAVIAGIVCGAGIIGLLLTLTVAALSGLRAKNAVEAPEHIDWQADTTDDAEPAGGSETTDESAPAAPAQTAVPAAESAAEPAPITR